MATVNYVPYARQSRTVLDRVAEYICRKDKTDDRRFISGQNCAPLFAVQEFAATRALDANIYSSFSDGRHRISFDHVVEVMKQTGKDLPSLYKETSAGGLALKYLQK